MIFMNGVNLQADCENCLPCTRCVLQAEEEILPTSVGDLQENMNETTAFLDTAPGSTIGSVAVENEFDVSDAVTTAGLKEFLRRPVRIASFTWSQSDAVGVKQTISPWHLYFNNANIKYKLNNFAFLRADLHVKIVVNASPFYYGSMRACYQPLPNFKNSTIVAGTSAGETNSELIPYSQQPGIWITPQSSEGGEMVLPFFYPRSYLKAQVASDFTDMGTLRFLIYAALQSANGASGTGVSVQVFAWAENVTLAGPSVGLAMQSDEYGTGPVSGVASTVASIAGKLKTIPILGKFATATEMGANAVAGIAKLFGFTNVPVIEPTMPYRPSPFPQLASPEIGYPVEKLTLDAKNELSIDPSVVGLSSDDPLAIVALATRQSYLTSATWSTATAVDTPLFTVAVSPAMGTFPNTGGSFEQNTPLSMLSKLFRSWRGDLIYTFRFVASPFHKGRVRISYDPYGTSVQTTSDTGPVVFNQIVDLGKETEVDVRIPYQQALAWCYTYGNILGSNKFSTSPTPALPYTDTYDNGILSVKVLTLLTAPVATSTIAMQVFVKAADNIEFGNPRTDAGIGSSFAMQADEYIETRVGHSVSMGENKAQIQDYRSRVYFGEAVGSVRQLLRRSVWLDSYVPTSDTTNFGVWTLQHTKWPLYYGYDPSGVFQAKGITATGTTFPANIIKNTAFQVVVNCFIGQRGSIHWHYNWDGPDVTMRATRLNSAPSPAVGYSGYLKGSMSYNQWALTRSQFGTGAGTALTNQKTQSGLSISVPNYTVFKFQSTDPRNSTAPTTTGSRYDGSCYEGVALEINSDATVTNLNKGRLERYFAIGTDYTPLFFLNCPSQYIYVMNDIP